MFIVPLRHLSLSTFQLNMVRQRKDGDSLERLDGSKPTWKVCVDARPTLSCLHVLFVLVIVSYRCSAHAGRLPPLCRLVLRIVELFCYQQH